MDSGTFDSVTSLYGMLGRNKTTKMNDDKHFKKPRSEFPVLCRANRGFVVIGSLFLEHSDIRLTELREHMLDIGLVPTETTFVFESKFGSPITRSQEQGITLNMVAKSSGDNSKITIRPSSENISQLISAQQNYTTPANQSQNRRNTTYNSDKTFEGGYKFVDSDERETPSFQTEVEDDTTMKRDGGGVVSVRQLFLQSLFNVAGFFVLVTLFSCMLLLRFFFNKSKVLRLYNGALSATNYIANVAPQYLKAFNVDICFRTLVNSASILGSAFLQTSMQQAEILKDQDL